MGAEWQNFTKFAAKSTKTNNEEEAINRTPDADGVAVACQCCAQGEELR